MDTAQDDVDRLATQMKPKEEDGKKKGRRERAPKQPKPDKPPKPVEVRVRKPYDAGAEARLTYAVCALIAAAGVALLWWLAHH